MINPYLYSYFISYSRRDRAFAYALDELLAAVPRSCWRDDHAIESSDHFPTAIAEGLIQSKQLIALVSKHSLQSKWCQAELWHHLTTDPTNSERRVIVVSLDGSFLPTPLDQLDTILLNNGLTEEVIQSILRVSRIDPPSKDLAA